MVKQSPIFETRLAKTDSDLIAAQRLRYDVFIRELGGDGPLVDHDAALERDALDPYFDHLLLVDTRRDTDAVIGVYRLLRDDQAGAAGGFYSESEYDLTLLKTSGHRLLELGRSCLHKDYRGGTAMVHLWAALADYVALHQIDILFGVASFHGTDIQALAQSLSLLHHRHLAPDALRVTAVPSGFQSMNLMPEAQIDRLAAMRNTPALIKAYLRLGGRVGTGAFIDHAFNTTDVCLVMETKNMPPRQRSLYAGTQETKGPGQ